MEILKIFMQQLILIFMTALIIPIKNILKKLKKTVIIGQIFFYQQLMKKLRFHIVLD